MEFVIERLLTKHILKKEKISEFVVIKEVTEQILHA